jgi:hypothetical protein
MRASLAFFLILLCADAAAETVLLHAVAAASADTPSAPPTSRASHSVNSSAQRSVALDAVAFNSMQPGDEASISAPDNVDYTVVFERAASGYGGGKVWVGYLRDFGKHYPVLISLYADRVDGSIATPAGKLRLHGSADALVITDLHAAGDDEFVPLQDDTLLAPVSLDQRLSGVQLPDISADSRLALRPEGSAEATGTAPSRIDLLLLFTPQLQAALGGYAATIARINLLVSVANTVYVNSGVNLSLNLVSAQAWNTTYSASTDTTALTSMQADGNVNALRSQYGADLVTLLRPFSASAGVCGLAYIPQDFSAASSAYGYSVVEDSGGSTSGAYCDVTSLTHELGHNLGAAHDLATSAAQGTNVNGVPSYNRGYCNGAAGTVMSYGNPSNGCSPIVPYFSNPALTTSCNGGSCGVPQGQTYTALGSTATAVGADSTSGINANAPAVSAWRNAPTRFVPIVPARLLDTRAGMMTCDGLYAGVGALNAGAALTLGVAGRGGIPTSAVGSVVMNVTATNPTAAGFITVWPTGSAMPLASNLNFVAGQTIPNLVIAKLGTAGSVSLFNGIGMTDLIADVVGWFPTTSGFNAIVPARLLDTRPTLSTIDNQYAGIGALGPGDELDLPVVGRGGVAATGVAAVALNVTVTQPSAPGYITAWPAGTDRPLSSNLNFVAGQTIPNLVISKVGTNGSVALYNSNGNTHLVADVAGWFATGSELTAIVPVRLLDNRPGGTTGDGQFAAGGVLGPGAELDLTVIGRAAVPATATAVVLNVTAVSPSAAGFLTVWPAGAARPTTSNLNFVAGDIIPNLVIAKIGANGAVAIFNSAGNTYVVADVVGWFAGN